MNQENQNRLSKKPKKINLSSRGQQTVAIYQTKDCFAAARNDNKNIFSMASLKLLNRAMLAVKILSLAPFIRMVGLTGSLARGEANHNSDIDFIIIAKTDRIWTTRIFAIGLMMLTGLKRTNQKIAGQVCLNLFHTTEHLTISYQDHLADKYWLAKDHTHLMPLLNSNHIFQDFVKANSWVNKYGQKFCYQNFQNSLIDKISLIFLGAVRLILEFLYDLILNDWGENWFRQIQTDRINRDPRTKNSPKGAIFISDFELRFHPPKDNQG